MKAIRLLLLLVFTLLPSALKIAILRARGARIGKSCKIGLSIIDAKNIRLGDHVRIGHFNLIWRLTELDLGTGSKIGDGNWVTGATKGRLRMGRNSSIRRFHYLEASGDILIGDNSILAGRGVQMFTHGLHPDDFEQVKPITIGDWCYIGAFAKFVPGVVIPKGTFVGMAAVLTKAYQDEYVLLAGNPATVKRALSPQAKYFQRPFLPLGHHPRDYRG